MLRRPATVSVAAWFQFVAALSFGLLAITIVYDLVNYPAWADALAAKVHTDAATVGSAKSDNSTGDIVALVLIFLFASGLVASGLMAMRRMRTGQIMSYVLSVGTMLCCGAATVAGYEGATGSTETFEDRASDATPGWSNGLAVVVVLALPCVIVAFVLLLTPSARRYFRGTPTAPSGYMYLPAPGAPGAPVYPNFPGYHPGQQWVVPTYPTYPPPTLVDAIEPEPVESPPPPGSEWSDQTRPDSDQL